MIVIFWYSRVGVVIVGGVYNEIVVYLILIIGKKIWFIRCFGFEEIMYIFRVLIISCF